MSGSFIATPGPSVAANYTVTAAIAGRPIIGTTAGATTISVNLNEPNTVFLDYKNQFDLRIAQELPLRQPAASRASPTSSTC